MEKEGLHQRSLSSSSSSSFDSCSDLLTSFDLSEKIMSDVIPQGGEEEQEEEEGGEHEKFQSESESCNKQISDQSHLDVLLSRAISRGHYTITESSLKEGDSSGSEAKKDSGQSEVIMTDSGQSEVIMTDSAQPEVVMNDSSQLEVIKDDSMTVETPAVRDHIYSFSSAMTLSMVRSLAENTVGRISQLQSSLRIPSGYIFSMKSTESIESNPAVDRDQEISKSRDIDDPSKENSILGSYISDLDGITVVQNMQKGDSNNIVAEDTVQEEDSHNGRENESSVIIEKDILEGLHSKDLMESLNGNQSGSSTNIEKDISEELPSDNLIQFVSGKSQSESLINGEKDISKAVHSNDLMEPPNGNQTGSSTNSEKGITNGLRSDDLMQVLSENKSGSLVSIERDISESLHSHDMIHQLNGNQTRSLINIEENISEGSYSDNLIQFLNGNQTGSSFNIVKDVSKRLLSSNVIPHPQMSESIVEARDRIDSASGSHGQNYGLLCNRDASVLSVMDNDLHHLESSVKSFELQKKTPVSSHPLHILNSGSGRPDLEEVDYDVNEEVCKNEPPDFSSSLPHDIVLHRRISVDELMRDEPDFSLKTSSLYHNTGGASPSLNAVVHCRDSVRNDGMHRIEAIEVLALKFREKNLLSHASFCEKRSNGETLKGLENEERDELFRYVENLDLNGTDVDTTILDMEDILLNSDEDGSRNIHFLPSSSSVVGTPRSSRDGSLSSSTSGLFGLYTIGSNDHFPFTIDWIEVIGAKQKKGGSSFGERVVGVKDHTVYCIKVTGGGQEWEVMKRYRDFVELYHQLKRKFNTRSERCLPTPWKEVESESRKVFGGTTPNVIEIRSTRIEKCLQSLLQEGSPFSNSSLLCWFLRPQGTVFGLSGYEDQESVAMSMSRNSSDVQLGALDSPRLQSPQLEIGRGKVELDHGRGKTIKLVLKVHSNKNLKQLLSSQRYSCAGCHKHLDVEKGLVQGFVQTLGWGKPRLCEYSGQLYCTSCHFNETAVLPAQVLWHWDFTPRRVSQLAKAYLDSIYDQPMLCVSAVNPHLYSRVPILMHVKETRRKVSRILSSMQCPSHTRIQHTMGSRKYLLEGDDFFALRDLEDLSKGAFAVLPGLLITVLESLMMHITKQCSTCQDMGEWCGARELCEDPFNPIFPFQEENVRSCKECHALYHKACFSKCISCPSCPSDGSKESTTEGSQKEFESNIHNQAEVFPLVDDIVNKTSSVSSSITRGAELEGPRETSLSQSQRYWPSFYGLLPKKRLWKS